MTAYLHKPTPLPVVREQRRIQKATALKKATDHVRARDKHCLICHGRATETDHLDGRIGTALTDVTRMYRVCRACHRLRQTHVIQEVGRGNAEKGTLRFRWARNDVVPRGRLAGVFGREGTQST